MTKNLKIALMVLVASVGIFLFNQYSQAKLISSSEAMFTDNPKDIFKFLIQSGEEAIELARIDTVWQISGNDTLVVKSQSIDNLFDKVLKVKRGTIISQNPEKYYKYSVDDSSGIHLAVINARGESIGYYVFGKSKSDYSRSHIRIGDDPNVYLANENVTYMLNTRETFWGEKPKEEIPPPPITLPEATSGVIDSTIN